MRLLVSLYNRYHERYSQELRKIFALTVESETEKVRVVPLPDCLTESAIDMAGICRYRGGYACLLPTVSGEAGSVLVILSPDLGVVSSHVLSLTRNPHSITEHEGKLYIASTGTDSIVEWDGRERVIWQGENGEQDTIHVNSLTWMGRNLYATAFGQRIDDWFSAVHGYIFNVSTGERIVEGLFHPHSLRSCGDILWFCESSRMQVRSTKGDCYAIPLGYLRGLVFTGKNFCVGSTVGRKHSKETGELIDNPHGFGARQGTCGIVVVSLNGTVEKFISLHHYADEIYDIEAMT